MSRKRAYEPVSDDKGMDTRIAEDAAMPETPMGNMSEGAQAEVEKSNGQSATSEPEKPKEAKDAKFFRLAVKRVPSCIKRIRHVANLANKNQYEYTPAHAQKIIEALRAEMKALENAFTGTKAPVEDWTL